MSRSPKTTTTKRKRSSARRQQKSRRSARLAVVIPPRKRSHSPAELPSLFVHILPLELLFEIAAYLPCADLLALGLASRQIYGVAYPLLYKRLLSATFENLQYPYSRTSKDARDWAASRGRPQLLTTLMGDMPFGVVGSVDLEEKFTGLLWHSVRSGDDETVRIVLKKADELAISVLIICSIIRVCKTHRLLSIVTEEVERRLKKSRQIW